MLSPEEQQLVDETALHQDSRSAEAAVDLLKVCTTSVSQSTASTSSQRSGSELPVSLLEEVMVSYAVVGDIVNAE